MAHTKKGLINGYSLTVLVIVVFLLSVRNQEPSEPARTDAERQAIGKCEEMIKAQATFPLSVSVHRLTGVATDANGAGGKPRVAMRFDAKNALGNELPYMANCDFGTDPPTLRISK